jgi:hypothetical protein
MAFCLVPQQVNAFKKGLLDGSINPDDLGKMTSDQRRKFLSKYVGETNAQGVNALFESKTLLKDQQRGMITWAKRVGGVSPQTRRDIIARIERMDEVLNPKEQQQFLKDLASTKLGVDVTQEEAKAISNLSKKQAQLKEKMDSKTYTFENESDRLDFGRAQVQLENYIGELKQKAEKITLADIRKNPLGMAGKLVSETAGTAKAIKASLDDSAIFRQGWKTLFTHPRTWFKNAKKSFGDLWRTFGKDEVMNELRADIISRKNYLNGYYNKAKLAIGTIEEAYPTHLPEKIPLAGKIYKASENAYTAFVYKTRVDVFDQYIDIANKYGVELVDDELKGIGKLSNSLTGRGSLGRLEPAGGFINNIFFSGRNLKSNIDTLTLHGFDKMTKFTRKEAAKNLLKISVGTAAVLGVANILRPGSVDWDPRSSNFGKIRIGNTRFDVSGGMSSIVTLASRILTKSSKSSSTGEVTKLNTGEYGSRTTKDVIYDFFENKLSPAASVLKDLAEGETFSGEKPTISNELVNLFVPLPITNYIELKDDPNSANALIATIADALGIGTNTYGNVKLYLNRNKIKDIPDDVINEFNRLQKNNNTPSTSDIEQRTTIKSFKEQVGNDKYKEFIEEYRKSLPAKYQDAIMDIRYLSLSDEEKKKQLDHARNSFIDDLLDKYGYKAPERKERQEYY